MEFDRNLLTFNPKNHGHYYDGERLLGVTTALGIISKGDALVQWAANQTVEYLRANLVGELSSEDLEVHFANARRNWRSVKQQAAEIGTYAHEWIESYLKGENPQPFEHFDPEVERQVRNSCSAGVAWTEEHRWTNLFIERQLFLPELRVAGICDWYALIDGHVALPDWKTSKDIYSTYRYQTAAYAKAIEREVGIVVEDRWILRIDKQTGEFDDMRLPREELEKDYKAFVNAVELYRREQELKKAWG